jgi:hypothetical protein
MASGVPPEYKLRLRKADLKALLAAAGDRPSVEWDRVFSEIK